MRWIILAGLVLSAGCQREPAPPRNEVNVTGQKGKGVQVEAPGVKVNVGKGGTDVRVDP